MLRLLYTGFFLLTGYSVIQASPPTIRPLIECNNYIVISGKTNINSFHLVQTSFEANKYAPAKIIDMVYSNSEKKTLTIPVEDFRADNQMIYRDFLKLVKAKQYPWIIINMPQLKRQGSDNEVNFYNVEITIAGVTRIYEISCYTERCDKEGVFIYGSRKLHLTDFNINPPEKTFGLIRVRNEVFVNFGFALNDYL